MDTPSDGARVASVDRCADQRTAVGSRCEEARRARTEHAASTERHQDLRRQLVAAQHRLADARAAADPQLRSDQKARAREIYEHAIKVAVGEAETAEATANWARALDRINRSGRLTKRTLEKASTDVAAIEAQTHEAERAEHTARIAADGAEAACLDARVRLAACEEQTQALARPPAAASVFEPHAATGGHAVAVPQLPQGQPLVIESLIVGDRRALELAGAEIAEHTGLQPAEAILQLRELVDAMVAAASRDGYLVFDDAHPFWAHLSVEEARDVIAALARLGFQFEPSEGWHAGRAPTPMDLSMALAYAGLDARNMRDLPTVEELRVLPQSISVDTRSFLATVAPDLAVDHVIGALDRRAAQLEPLWNEWGQVRPILLSDRHTLGTPSG